MKNSFSDCKAFILRAVAVMFTAILFSFINVSGQRSVAIDSLYRCLSAEKSDTGKVMIMYRISHELQNSDIDKSYEVAIKALDESKRLKFRRGEGNAMVQLGNVEQIKGNFEAASEYYNNALAILQKINDKKGEAICYNNLGIIAQSRSDFDEAASLYKRSLGISRALAADRGTATSLFCLGSLMENRAQFDSALICYHEAIGISEKLGDKKLMAFGKVSIGNIKYRMGDIREFFNYTTEALAIYEETDNYYGVLKTCLSLGETSKLVDSLDLALFYFREALKDAVSFKSLNDIAYVTKSIAEIYFYQGREDSAIINYNRAAGLYRQTGSSENQALTQIAFAAALNSRKEYNSALKLLKESMVLADQCQSPAALTDVSMELAKTYSYLGNFESAFYHMNRYSEIRDSLMSAEKQKQILELQTKYETEKKEQENLILKKDQKLLRTTRNSLIVGALMLGLIILVVMNSLWIKKRDNRILKEQKEEIRQQKEIVELQKTSITDSIHYARRIQSAMLPPSDAVHSSLPDSFILYLPRDIVSGDFYWIRQISESKILLCAADCTGHGVPGAFMSMLGMSLLTDIVNTFEDQIGTSAYTPADILNELRIRIKSSLRQTGKDGETRDGMDVSLCLLDTASGILQYSGANNSVYIVSDGNLTELKATRNPIGIYPAEVSFTNQEQTLLPGSVFYMFSDGYADQIGADGKKFMSRNFKKLLSEISLDTVSCIREKLHMTHLDWRKDEEQMDDILVIGVRV
jgi:serine phosphatase RsbU (regulator of sigma subunit)